MVLEVSFLGSTLKQYLIALCIVALAFGIGKIAYWVMSRIVRTFTARTKTKLDDLIIDLIDTPIVVLIALAGLKIGVDQLSLNLKAAGIIDKVLFILFILNVSWVIINLIDAIIKNYLKPMAEKSKNGIDNAVAGVAARIVKIILWAVVILAILSNLGYNISALIAGLGIGGLAIALAAQDLLSNLFGGFAILSDKPFKIGDRVKWGTNDGFVREIGFRTTRIETLDGTMLVVSNSELAKTTLENISKEPARRVVLKIGLVYNTPTRKVKQAEDILKEIILKNSDLKDDAFIGFSDFGDFALIITAVYFIKDPSKVLTVKSAVNREIKDRFEKARLEFAYPTQSIVMEKKRK
jgi:MscS family membrane protein